ncbi:hypothetical protein LG293_15960 (plasmid) [Citricoccus nitrophenolicus]
MTDPAGTPTIYLDIDGVIFSYGHTPPEGTGLTYLPHPEDEGHWYSPEAVGRINALADRGVRIAWLSSVHDKAEVCQITGLGGEHWDNLEWSRQHQGFQADWKLLALAEDLAAHRPADWVWIEDGMLSSLCDLVNPAHLVLPDTMAGITADDLDALEARFEGVGSHV